jgi:hypothetical protein
MYLTRVTIAATGGRAERRGGEGNGFKAVCLELWGGRRGEGTMMLELQRELTFGYFGCAENNAEGPGTCGSLD